MIHFFGTGPPFAAVRRLAAVVAHHVVLAVRNRDLARQIAGGAFAVEPGERLVLALTVDVDGALQHLEPVPRHADDALDEVRVRALRRPLRAGLVAGALHTAAVRLPRGRLEDDDVAAVGVAEAEAHAVHQHPLADLERRHHRLARDAERLDEEGLDAERKPQRHRDDGDELDQRVVLALPLALGHGHPGPVYDAWSSPGGLLGRLLRGLFALRLGVGGLGLALGLGLLRGGLLRELLLAGARRVVRRHRALLDQARLDRLVRLRPGPAALAHARRAADPVAQVVELGAAHVAAGRDLDPLDLRGVDREGPLHAHAERLLAHREGLAHAASLALDHDALEDLRPPARALDDLEVHAHAVTRLEGGDTAQLRALDAVDYAGHRAQKTRPWEPSRVDGQW